MMSPRGPLITLNIPRIEHDPLPIDMSPGDVLFVLGANGTGKSGLIQHLYRQYRDEAIRITAHRQTWMGSSQVEISPKTKRQHENQLREQDIHSRARWHESYAGSRYQMSLLNLIQARNARNAAAIRALHEGKKEEFEELSSEQGDYFFILNRVLLHSNMSITIEIQEDEEIIATRDQKYSYGIAEMSDAERSILLLAADILTCPRGTAVLIDEPERHIHRSISSSVIQELLSCRPDCIFVISTHDVILPMDIGSAKILMLRDCEFQGKEIVGRDADFIDSASDIDESLKRDILGSRRNLLFIEGTNSSLDSALYSILFPGISIIPKGSRRDVEGSVRAIQGAAVFHWLRAYGIVDDDGYSDGKKKTLRSQGIYPLNVYQIESIFYDSQVQDDLFPEKSRELYAARKDAMATFSAKIEFLAGFRASQKRREQVLQLLPDPENFQVNETITIESGDILREEIDMIQNLIDHEDYDSIIRKYPIRKTSALDQIAKKLGFLDRHSYEHAVLYRIKSNVDVLAYAKSMLGGLPDRIAEDNASSESQ